MRKFLLGLLVACSFGLMYVSIFSNKAGALADPIGKFRSYEVTCDTTPRRMSPTSGWIPTSAFKMTVGVTPIYVGGSDVNATTAGTPYTAGEKESFDGSPGSLWCVTASGSSVVDILSGTKG